MIDLPTASQLGKPDWINSLDIQGWNCDSAIFPEIIKEVKPKLIVEVGTWKGASAIHMASLVKALNLDTKIVCVDTWLGALEMWTDREDKDRYLSLNLKNGYPTVYYQFLYNVIEAGYGDIIIPFPQTSLIASRYFRDRNIMPDLVYIDASHDDTDVFMDLTSYWDILKVGGIIFGDDYYTWQGVRNAVDRFNLYYKYNFEVQGNHWILRK